MNAQELQSYLCQFSGSENIYYRNSGVIRVDYTEGVRFLQQQGFYWLIDAIASYQTSAFKMADDRQFWKLVTDLENSSAVLTCDDGNGNVRVTQHIPYTDCPLQELRIWVVIQPRVFLFLPSEN